jgi:hypothetical protein
MSVVSTVLLRVGIDFSFGTGPARVGTLDAILADGAACAPHYRRHPWADDWPPTAWPDGPRAPRDVGPTDADRPGDPSALWDAAKALNE